MKVSHITPILNVSDIAATFVWFEKFGWKKLWDWGTPPTFGAVGPSDGDSEISVFLCLNAQGSRGKGDNTTTFTVDGDEAADKGVWLSIWVSNVDEVYKRCVDAGLDVTFAPADMPWGARETHVRHPDGHVFRISEGREG